MVRDLCAEGRTVVLTTHYMDEAQALADSVVVLAGGRVVAAGSPDTLGGRDHGVSTVRFALPVAWPSPTCRCPPGLGAGGPGRIRRVRRRRADRGCCTRPGRRGRSTGARGWPG